MIEEVSKPPAPALSGDAVRIERLTSWQEVPELFEQRSPGFAELRASVLRSMLDEQIVRIIVNPEKTDEELSAGVMREQLEPQCRDAVFAIRQKGYETFSSGFGVGNLQVLDGVFGNIDSDTLRTLTQHGFLVFETQPGHVSIAFKPERPDLAEMTDRWNQLARLLPDLGRTVSHDQKARNRYFADFQIPNHYGYETSLRLEDKGAASKPAIFLSGIDRPVVKKKPAQIST